MFATLLNCSHRFLKMLYHVYREVTTLLDAKSASGSERSCWSSPRWCSVAPP